METRQDAWDQELMFKVYNILREYARICDKAECQMAGSLNYTDADSYVLDLIKKELLDRAKYEELR